MSNITIIKSLKPDTLGKRFKLDGNGTMKKSVVASVWKGKAKRLNTSTFKELTNLLKGVCEASDIALMAGCFIDAEHGEAVNLVTKEKLTKLLKCDEKDTPGGVQEIDGEKYVARVKLGVEPGNWLLIDADNPEGIPDKWRVLNLQDRLELLEPLVAGDQHLSRVLSTARPAHVLSKMVNRQAALHTRGYRFLILRKWKSCVNMSKLICSCRSFHFHHRAIAKKLTGDRA